MITTVSMVANLQSFYAASNWLLLGIAAAIAVLEVWIVFEGVGALFASGPEEQPAK